MTPHLSRERISELLVGPGDHEAMEHLGSCPECGAELAELSGAISSFAVAARGWSQRHDSREVQLTLMMERGKHRSRAAKLAWGLTMAVTLLLLFWGTFHTWQGRRQTEALNSESDDALMRQIDAEVSRRAPAAMDPLVRAISASASSAATQNANTNPNSQDHGEEKQ